MKEKYNFEFPFTTNYGFSRAILDLPQVNFMSAGSARGILLSQQVNMVNLKSAKPLWSFFPQKMPILSYLTKVSKIMGSPKAQVKHGSRIKGDHVQIPFKLAANLWKALKSEISYNCVVIEGYETETSYGELSFHQSEISSWLWTCLSQKTI